MVTTGAGKRTIIYPILLNNFEQKNPPLSWRVPFIRHFYLEQVGGRHTTGQSGVGVQFFVTLQSAILHSFFALAFLRGFLSVAKAVVPAINSRAVTATIIFFI